MSKTIKPTQGHLTALYRALRTLPERRFLCCALGVEGVPPEQQAPAVRELRALLQHRLQGNYTVGGWLQDQGIEQREEHLPNRDAVMLEYRRLWTESLIAEFQFAMARGGLVYFDRKE